MRFVVVRHAEKDPTVRDDPPLSSAGQARARRLAEALRKAPLAAVYSTAYRRTRQTAQPAADAHRLGIVAYHAREDASAFAARLRTVHPDGAALVVGHSNTVPAIVRALCGCAVADIDDATYGQLYEVRIAADGKPTLQVGAF